MTVVGANHRGEVICRWFWGNRLETEYFSPETLARAEPDTPAGD